MLLRHLPQVGNVAASCGQRTLSMANQEMVVRQMESAGYDQKNLIRRDQQEAITFSLAIGPAAEVFWEAS